MAYLLNIQLALFSACFLTGSVGAVFLLRNPSRGLAWKIADLIWVLLGGFGAIIAILAGAHLSDSSQLDRQIDLTRSAATTFDRDAGRFRLRYCETATDTDTKALCERVELMSATTAINAKLPLFLDRSSNPQDRSDRPGRRFRQNEVHAQRIMQDAEGLDLGEILMIDLNPDETKAIVSAQRDKDPAIAGDFLILNRSYDDLIDQVSRLQDEWARLRERSRILMLQLVALCLISFAAPFRLGKSLADLRQSVTK